jgi:hypothetical protein
MFYCDYPTLSMFTVTIRHWVRFTVTIRHWVRFTLIFRHWVRPTVTPRHWVRYTVAMWHWEHLTMTIQHWVRLIVTIRHCVRFWKFLHMRWIYKLNICGSRFVVRTQKSVTLTTMPSMSTRLIGEYFISYELFGNDLTNTIKLTKTTYLIYD